MEIGTSS
jgi:dynein heavy chain